MTDGQVLLAGQGQLIETAGMTLKVGAGHTQRWSAFEATVPPGFDVGAHVHGEAEEIFYVLDGELDLLAFHPQDQAVPDWSGWQSAAGSTPVRGGPGAFMFVPAGCPHAFANRSTSVARMLFLVSPAGHEHYLSELGALLRQAPDQDAIGELRSRHDIRQLTPLAPGGVPRP